MNQYTNTTYRQVIVNWLATGKIFSPPTSLTTFFVHTKIFTFLNKVYSFLNINRISKDSNINKLTMIDFLPVLGSAAVLPGFEQKNSPSETEDAWQTMERYHFSVLQ